MSIDSVDFGIQIHFVSAFFAAKWAFQKNLSNFMLYYRRLFFQKKKNWIHPIKKIALDWLTMLWSVSIDLIYNNSNIQQYKANEHDLCELKCFLW